MTRLFHWIPAALILLGCRAAEPAPDLSLKLDFTVGTLAIAHDASLRGLAAPGDDVVWVSGSGGTVLRSLDRGLLFRRVDPPGAGTLDFRMLVAFDAEHAWVGSAGPGATSRLFETRDGGKTWLKRLVNEDPDGFWDALAFWDEDHGVLVGDAVGGYLTVMGTRDGGATWARVPESSLPASPSLLVADALHGGSGESIGEVCFAASNRSLALGPGGLAWIGTGGSVARVWRSLDWGLTWTAAETPLGAGDPASGVFAVAFRDASRGVVVGGKYDAPDDSARTAAWTKDGGRSWYAAQEPPAGYRSAVVPVPSDASGLAWLAVGTSGSSLAGADGNAWTSAPHPALNALAIDPGGAHAYAVGPKGHFALLPLDPAPR